MMSHTSSEEKGRIVQSVAAGAARSDTGHRQDNKKRDHTLQCWSCSDTISQQPVQVPLEYDHKKKTFGHMHGIFCCLPCGQRYIQHNNKYPELIRRTIARNIAHLRYESLKKSNASLAKQLTFFDVFVRTSPNPLVLKSYGGIMTRTEYRRVLNDCKRLSPRPVARDKNGEALPGEYRERLRKNTEYSRICLTPILPGTQTLPGPSYNCYLELPVAACDNRLIECDDRSCNSTIFSDIADKAHVNANARQKQKNKTTTSQMYYKLKREAKANLRKISTQHHRKRMLPLRLSWQKNSSMPWKKGHIENNNSHNESKISLLSTKTIAKRCKQRPLSDFF